MNIGMKGFLIDAARKLSTLISLLIILQSSLTFSAACSYKYNCTRLMRGVGIEPTKAFASGS